MVVVVAHPNHIPCFIFCLPESNIQPFRLSSSCLFVRLFLEYCTRFGLATDPYMIRGSIHRTFVAGSCGKPIEIYCNTDTTNMLVVPAVFDSWGHVAWVRFFSSIGIIKKQWATKKSHLDFSALLLAWAWTSWLPHLLVVAAGCSFVDCDACMVVARPCDPPNVALYCRDSIIQENNNVCSDMARWKGKNKSRLQLLEKYYGPAFLAQAVPTAFDWTQMTYSQWI